MIYNDLLILFSLNALKVEYLTSLLYAGGGSLGVGTAKEVFDYFHPKKYTTDIKDIYADVFGIIVTLVGLYLSKSYICSILS